jgi:hypothetical protein
MTDNAATECPVCDELDHPPTCPRHPSNRRPDIDYDRTLNYEQAIDLKNELLAQVDELRRQDFDELKRARVEAGVFSKDAEGWKARALAAEASLERIKYGLDTGHGFTIYGTEKAMKQTAEWYEELLAYRRKEAREEELRQLKAELDWFKRRERVVRDALDCRSSAIQYAVVRACEWEEANPRPESSDAG